MRSTVRYLKSNNTTIEVTNTQLRVALLREYAFSITLRFCLSIFENKSKKPTYAQLVRDMGGNAAKTQQIDAKHTKSRQTDGRQYRGQVQIRNFPLGIQGNLSPLMSRRPAVT